jgi:hypothetical protein
MLKNILAILISAVFSLTVFAGDTFSYDGHYEASEYDISFDIDYYYEVSSDNPTGIVQGGTLAFANHGEKQYMYISHPLGFKDLSYGKDGTIETLTCDAECEAKVQKDKDNKRTKVLNSKDCKDSNSEKCTDKIAEKVAKTEEKSRKNNSTKTTKETKADDYLVGWMNRDQKDADKAIGSEFVNLSFKNGDNTYTLDLNPSIPNKNDNKVGIEGDIEVSFLSTLNYNASLLNNGDFYGSLGEFEDHSPKTIDCPLGETSSDESCYKLAEGINPKVTDWEFEWGLEVELSKELVNISSLLPQNFAYKGTLGEEGADGKTVLVSLNELHASDPKTLSAGKHQQGNCANDKKKAPDHEPCGATVVNGPDAPSPKPVPEPSAFVLLGLGIFGIWYKRNKMA